MPQTSPIIWSQIIITLIITLTIVYNSISILINTSNINFTSKPNSNYPNWNF